VDHDLLCYLAHQENQQIPEVLKTIHYLKKIAGY
jgi:hypothetical protein